uniref:GRB10 interacting GYF protein 1b n=1 Tax=Cyprinus carpio carpio TaxID=630221 RepID=A0A8C1BQE3_CYPCA
MTAETLNFGPEWLRALSRGGSVTSPPPSPAMPKSKLADYRYGREEMLALYVKDDKIPEDMQDKEFAAILQEEPQQPLALVPLTEEEQRNFSMSVNSVAVLRLMGKGGGAVPTGVARGRGSTRGGRGRGRGEGGFYQRSVDEEVGFGRGREMHRSQSWDDRGERRFEKPLRRDGGRGGFEEGGAGGRKDYARSDSENWRTLREEQEDDDGAEPGGSWRIAGRRDDGGPRSAGWRDHSSGDGRRRKFDFDFRDGEGGRRRAGSEGGEDDRDGLPEWCTDEEEGEMGTFDSSGAFMCIKKSSRDAIPEDQELEFEALEEEEEGYQEKQDSPADKYFPLLFFPRTCNAKQHWTKTRFVSIDAAPADSTTPQMQSSSPPSTTGTDLPTVGGDTEEEDGMKHLQQEAEKMVASLQDTSLEEECYTQAASALPLSHESAMKWFYKDPQGEIQGPFTTVEMCEWFQAGYFTMNLLVKRGCDEGFQPLGEVIKMWGRVPFSPGPSPPPLLGNMDQELLKKQLEQAATAALYQQLQMRFQHVNRYHRLANYASTGMMPAMNRSMSVPDTGPMWDMPTSVSQQSGGETSLWDLTMSNSTQGPTLEHLQKRVLPVVKREEEERKRREEKRRQQEEQKRREEEELYRRKQHCFVQHGGLTMGQWSDGPSGMWSGAGMDGKVGGGNSAMGMWDEAMKNQASHRNIGLKNSRSSPSLSDQYLLNRRKRTDDEDRLLKLLQGMKPQDGFTTWCEQMLHALNTSANNSSSLDVPTIVAYLKEVESPYEVHDFIRIYLGDTIEAKEFAKQFLERRAKQKANHQRQQQQSMFQAAHMSKGGSMYDTQGGKAKKKPSMMLHSDPSILG